MFEFYSSYTIINATGNSGSIVSKCCSYYGNLYNSHNIFIIINVIARIWAEWYYQMLFQAQPFLFTGCDVVNFLFRAYCLKVDRYLMPWLHAIVLHLTKLVHWQQGSSCAKQLNRYMDMLRVLEKDLLLVVTPVVRKKHLLLQLQWRGVQLTQLEGVMNDKPLYIYFFVISFICLSVWYVSVYINLQCSPTPF